MEVSGSTVMGSRVIQFLTSIPGLLSDLVAEVSGAMHLKGPVPWPSTVHTETIAWEHRNRMCTGDRSDELAASNPQMIQVTEESDLSGIKHVLDCLSNQFFLSYLHFLADRFDQVVQGGLNGGRFGICSLHFQ
jgi:hypothetical protein